MHRIGPSILETDRGAQDIRDSFVATWIKRAGTEGDDQELEQKATLARSLPEAHFNGATSNHYMFNSQSGVLNLAFFGPVT